MLETLKNFVLFEQSEKNWAFFRLSKNTVLILIIDFSLYCQLFFFNRRTTFSKTRKISKILKNLKTKTKNDLPERKIFNNILLDCNISYVFFFSFLYLNKNILNIDNLCCENPRENGNLLRNKPSYQSSTYLTWWPFMAVTYPITMNYQAVVNGTCSQTSENSFTEGPWFIVDLKDVYKITKVCILNRSSFGRFFLIIYTKRWFFTIFLKKVIVLITLISK